MKELQTKVKELLQNKTVDLVIGWEKGTLPLKSSPLFVNNVNEVEKLIFDPTCGNNLTTYLTKDRRRLSKEYKKTGIIVKGCDARALALYITENQVKREQVLIIGVPCVGVLEPKKIDKLTDGREVLEKEFCGDEIILKGKNFEKKVLTRKVLRDCCLSCRYPDAPVYDFFIGEHRGEQKIENEFEEVVNFEKLTSEQRWLAVEKEYSRCIRCYACRNVCPACYCNECFVDHNNPQWVGKSPEITDNIVFHLIRNLHLAGRCVDCGACVSACPVNIDLRLMSRKVEKEVKERFGYIAGLNTDEKPAMASYQEDEKQDFIMG